MEVQCTCFWNGNYYFLAEQWHCEFELLPTSVLFQFNAFGHCIVVALGGRNYL